MKTPFLALAAGLTATLSIAASPPAPPDNPLSKAKIELGRRLFYDADLSLDGTMACATCHEQRHAFADGNSTHPGVTGEPGRRNVPGLANVAWFSPLTYADPRQTTLEAQVSVPVLGTHPVEMGMHGHENEIAERLGQDPCYRTMFARAFPAGGGRVDFTNVTKALASFERTLVSYNSAYDRGPLTGLAAQGSAIFTRDCAGCHAGPRFTDLAFHRLEPLDPHATDQGAFEITGKEADRGAFRTPSLRNVTLTGPWWHNGSAKTLEQAIMRHGKSYTTEDMNRLAAFLAALADRSFISDKNLSLPARACGRRL